MPYLIQQAPAMIKAREPATMKTLLMTVNRYIQTVRGRESGADLWASEEDMVPD